MLKKPESRGNRGFGFTGHLLTNLYYISASTVTNNVPQLGMAAMGCIVFLLVTGAPTLYPPVGYQCWPPALPPSTLLLVTNAGHWQSHPLPAVGHQCWPPVLPPSTLLFVTNAGHRRSHPLPSCWLPMLATSAPTDYPPVGYHCCAHYLHTLSWSHGGVSKLLKDQVYFIVANHCVAHRLALAAGQSANEIPYLKCLKDILDQLYRSYEYSAGRTAGLKEIQMIPR